VASGKKKNRPPVCGPALGPDKKGRFYLNPSELGKKLFFYGGVPGEEVRVRRGRRGRRGEQGDLLAVLQPGAERREAPCRHFGVCGGCTLQHLQESYSLVLKTEPHYSMLAAQFPEAEFFSPVASPVSFGYRTKVELTFLDNRDGQGTLGFHRRGRFDRGVDVGRCWLTHLSPSLLSELRSWKKRWGLRGWEPKNHTGDLRYLLYRISSSSQDDLVALVVNSELVLQGELRSSLIRALQSHGVRGAVLLFQSSVSGAVKPDREEVLYGSQVLTEEVLGLKFNLGWQSFFQVNPPAYARLLQTMREWRLTPAGGRVIDLFCGVGSIGLCLYHEGDQLYGVELVDEAVADARRNALLNNIQAKFECLPAEECYTLEGDLMILDPPRSGCHPKLLEALREKAPAKELFYVSCNPHRLQEELEFLAPRYRLRRARAFDFFPQTHHSEMLLQFERK